MLHPYLTLTSCNVSLQTRLAPRSNRSVFAAVSVMHLPKTVDYMRPPHCRSDTSLSFKKYWAGRAFFPSVISTWQKRCLCLFCPVIEGISIHLWRAAGVPCSSSDEPLWRHEYFTDIDWGWVRDQRKPTSEQAISNSLLFDPLERGILIICIGLLISLKALPVAPGMVFVVWKRGSQLIETCNIQIAVTKLLIFQTVLIQL